METILIEDYSFRRSREARDLQGLTEFVAHLMWSQNISRISWSTKIMWRHCHLMSPKVNTSCATCQTNVVKPLMRTRLSAWMKLPSICDQVNTGIKIIYLVVWWSLGSVTYVIWYCGETWTKQEQTHRRSNHYLKPLVVIFGVWDFMTPLCHFWGITIEELANRFFFSIAEHKRSKTTTTDLKILPKFFSVNVSSKAAGCFKSYQHQESATFVNLIKSSRSAGHLALLLSK